MHVRINISVVQYTILSTSSNKQITLIIVLPVVMDHASSINNLGHLQIHHSISLGEHIGLDHLPITVIPPINLFTPFIVFI